MTPAAVALPTLAFITLFLDLPPLFMHIKNHNVAAISLVVWTILENLFNFINPIVWPTDNLPIWFAGYGLCDVEVKIMIMANFGITGSLTCIMRRLAHVLDTENATLAPSKEQRRLQRIVTAGLCFGGPIYALVVSFLIQGNRYYIFAIAGCTPSVDSSWPPLVIYVMWPPIICMVAVYYCGKPRIIHFFCLLY